MAKQPKSISLSLDRLRDLESSLVRNSKYNRPRDGKTILRVFTFTHIVNDDDFNNGVFRRGSPFSPSVGDTVREVALREVTHYIDKKTVRCPGLGCTYCAEAAKIRDEKARGQMSARRAFQVNAVDVENPEDGVKIWTLPTSVFKEILSVVNSGEHDPSELFGPNGRDFVIKKDKTQPAASMYKTMLRDSDKCSALPESFTDSVTDLISAYYGSGNTEEPKEEEPATKNTTQEDDDEPKAKTVEPKPAAKKAAAKKSTDSLLGCVVSFSDGEGSTLTGQVTKVEDGAYHVTLKDGDEWVMSREDLLIVKEKP